MIDWYDDFRTREKWWTDRPFLNFFREIWFGLTYRFPAKIKDARYSIKWAFQRAFRGYDDAMCWSYPYRSGLQTVAILKWLKEHKHGIPSLVCEDGETFEESENKWNVILDKMILGWESGIAADDVFVEKPDGTYDIDATRKEYDRLMGLWREGMELYSKYYWSLWD